MDDPKLQVINDLGPTGQSKAIIEGVIATMKALEVATVLNKASLKGEVWVNTLSSKWDALSAKVTELEGEVAGKRSVAEERACQVAVVEKQLVDARTALEAATELSRKLAEEKVA